MDKKFWAGAAFAIAAVMGLAGINAMARHEPEPKRFCVPLYDQTGLECVTCE